MASNALPVGVILPPNEIRSMNYLHKNIFIKICKFFSLEIADKTAEFVAKNGSSFEELVIQ